MESSISITFVAKIVASHRGQSKLLSTPVCMGHIQSFVVFFRKRNALQRRLVCAERTRKIYLIKSARTHFLSSSLVYSAEWCRVPAALNNVHFDLFLNPINKCERKIHILAISQSCTCYQINGVL